MNLLLLCSVHCLLSCLKNRYHFIPLILSLSKDQCIAGSRLAAYTKGQPENRPSRRLPGIEIFACPLSVSITIVLVSPQDQPMRSWSTGTDHHFPGRSSDSRIVPGPRLPIILRIQTTATCQKIAAMLRTHREPLLNWFRCRGQIALGAVEGFNNKAKVTTRKAFGFSSFDVLKIA
jgi:hypothetical protein